MTNEEMIGKRFGRLTVLSQAPKDNSGHTRFYCLCDCGNTTIARADGLKNLNTRSCGCLAKEKSSERFTTHGGSKERLYSVWKGMKRRCYDPNHNEYHRYGGRGITVCEEWINNYAEFRDFMISNGYDEEAGFGECTIDRIDNDKGYFPDNCRVTTIKQQALNKSTNHFVKYRGKIMTVTEAADLAGIDRDIVFSRLAKGWEPLRAIRTPIKKTSLYEANGEEHSIPEWANILGTTDAVIRGRLRKQAMQEIVDNWNPDDSNKEHSTKCTYFTVDGETHSEKEWAEVLGISYPTLRGRLKKYTMEQIVHDERSGAPKTCKKYIEYNGKKLSLSDWAKELNILYHTFRYMLKSKTIKQIVEESGTLLNSSI